MRFMVIVKATKDSEAASFRMKKSSPRWGNSTKSW